MKSLTLEMLEKAHAEAAALPKGQWMLIAPDGRFWRDEQIRSIALVAAQESLRAAGFWVAAPDADAARRGFEHEAALDALGPPKRQP